MKKKLKILIGTPSYDGKLDIYYIDSLLNTIAQSEQNGIEVYPLFMCYDSLVQRARNDLFKAAYDSQMDMLIFIDGDHVAPTPLIDARNCLAMGHKDTIYVMDDTNIINGSFSVSDITEYIKVAIKFKSGDSKLFINGVEEAVGNHIFSTIGIMDRLYSATYNGSSTPFHGSIKDLRIYKSIAEAQKDLTYIN